MQANKVGQFQAVETTIDKAKNTKKKAIDTKQEKSQFRKGTKVQLQFKFFTGKSYSV